MVLDVCDGERAGRARQRCVVALSLEETLIEVWRQTLVENAKKVVLGSNQYVVRHTPKLGLRQVDFMFQSHEIRGLEQNPGTKSRWAALAREGKKVMQFLCDGRYTANVTAGKVTLYSRHARASADPVNSSPAAWMA